MGASRVLLAAVLLLSGVAPFAAAQAPPSTPASVPAQADQTPGDQAKRNALMEPALDKMRAGDPAGALAAFGPALSAYPNDPLILRMAGQAALMSRQYPEALSLFDRALATRPAEPWPLRLARMQAESRLGKMSDFDKDLADLRAAKKAGDPQLSANAGFIIDAFDTDAGTVQAVVFPLLAGRFHTLYRFLLPKSGATQPIQAGVNTGGAQDRCADPNFQPYIDVESDDIDQVTYWKEHPDAKAKGDRTFSLDSYPSPCSQGLMRFFNGEPKYEDARAAIAAKKK